MVQFHLGKPIILHFEKLEGRYVFLCPSSNLWRPNFDPSTSAKQRLRLTCLWPNPAQGLAHHRNPINICWPSHLAQYPLCQLAFLTAIFPLNLCLGELSLNCTLQSQGLHRIPSTAPHLSWHMIWERCCFIGASPSRGPALSFVPGEVNQHPPVIILPLLSFFPQLHDLIWLFHHCLFLFLSSIGLQVIP